MQDELKKDRRELDELRGGIVSDIEKRIARIQLAIGFLNVLLVVFGLLTLLQIVFACLKEF